MSPRRPPVLIVGVGNELLGDEGLGVHVARSLLALKPLPEGVEVIEAGTAFFDVLPDLAGRTRVIIVDAIRMGGEPGAVYRAELDGEPGAEAAKAGSLSLHDSGVWEGLAAARLLGLLPERLVLIGAEPERVEFNLDLSETLRHASARIVTALLDEAGGAMRHA